MKKYYFIIFIILLFSPLVSKAAILYLSPEGGEYHLGDVFMVGVKIDTEGEYINTVQVDLNFSADILEIQDLSEGNSILSLWVEKPKYADNKIFFIGGIPGGYEGPDGLIGTIVFRVKNPVRNYAQVLFEKSSKVLLNDGKGTEARIVAQGEIFNILPERLEEPENEWQKNLAQDKVSPQSFKIELSQNSLIFDGKYFITFSTTDKQTGIDHYEVMEDRKEWKVGNSPYVLENQELTNDIKVKAIDKAGNYWLETLKAPNKTEKKWEIIFLILISMFIIIGIGWIIRKRELKKRLKDEIQ